MSPLNFWDCLWLVTKVAFLPAGGAIFLRRIRATKKSVQAFLDIGPNLSVLVGISAFIQLGDASRPLWVVRVLTVVIMIGFLCALVAWDLSRKGRWATGLLLSLTHLFVYLTILIYVSCLERIQ